MNDDDLQTVTRRLVASQSDLTGPREAIWTRVSARRQPQARVVPDRGKRRALMAAASITLLCAAAAGALGVARMWARMHAPAAASRNPDDRVLSNVVPGALKSAATTGWPDLDGGRGRGLQMGGAPGHSLTQKAGQAAAAGVHPQAASAVGQMTASLPVHAIGSITARATVPMGLIDGVVPVGIGRVVVNERNPMRLRLLDSTLTRATLIMDPSDSTPRRIVNPAMGLLRFRGDSVLFVDADIHGFVVIAPDGSIGRTMAYPSAAISPREGVYAFSDRIGNILYQIAAPSDSSALRSAPPGVTVPPRPRYYLIRANLATRKTDTVSIIDGAIAWFGTTVVVDSAGVRHVNQTVNPFPQSDAWTTLSDGTIAIVRGQDFHVDWIAPDGTRTSSAKLPHEWRRFTDSAKAAIHDSLTRLYDSQGCSGAGGSVMKVRADGSRQVVAVSCRVAPAPEQIPDYAPPFFAQDAERDVKADEDGNIWIREAADTTVYDVVNRQGEMFDRRQIPGGTFIVAFDPGVVYLASREGPSSYSLVRAKIR